MKKQWTLALALAAAITFLAASGAQAYQEVRLENPNLGENVEGMATIGDMNASVYRDVEVYVTGLEPNSVYSVWFAKDEPSREMTEAGIKDEKSNFFKTDGSGNGHYGTQMTEPELYRWDSIEVVHHPDKDPSNVSDATVALRGEFTPY